MYWQGTREVVLFGGYKREEYKVKTLSRPGSMTLFLEEIQRPVHFNKQRRCHCKDGQRYGLK